MPEPSRSHEPRRRRRLPDIHRHVLRLLPRRRVTTVKEGDRVIVQLSGEITSKNAERIGDVLRSALGSHPRILEIDLRRVTHLGSGAARAFLTAIRAAEPRGARVAVTHASPQARATFSRLGLSSLLDIHDGAAPESE
ncbi:STAS domain-containing protein [Streptomyces sp. NPDC003480]